MWNEQQFHNSFIWQLIITFVLIRENSFQQISFKFRCNFVMTVGNTHFHKFPARSVVFPRFLIGVPEACHSLPPRWQQHKVREYKR